jgi:hypothetical protein
MLVILSIEAFNIQLAPDKLGRLPDIPKLDSRRFTTIADADKEIDIVIAKRQISSPMVLGEELCGI